MITHISSSLNVLNLFLKFLSPSLNAKMKFQTVEKKIDTLKQIHYELYDHFMRLVRRCLPLLSSLSTLDVEVRVRPKFKEGKL